MDRRSLSVLVFGACLQAGLGVSCSQSSDEEKAVGSFKRYVRHHLESYKANRRERTALLGGGWAKEYFEADVSSAKIDAQRTTSLISPYTGQLEFRLLQHHTAFHKSRNEAMADTVFPGTSVTWQKHTYVYQEAKWAPTVRQHILDGLDQWSDCTEVIRTGPNIGQTDLSGCMEEYDDVKER